MWANDTRIQNLKDILDSRDLVNKMLEAIAFRLEAIAFRLEAMSSAELINPTRLLITQEQGGS